MAAALAVALLGAGTRAAAASIQIPVERTRLANGLNVLVHEDRTLPIVSVYLFYRAGSRNEQPGLTGISHLFEHMMFNGGVRTEGKFDEVIESNGGSTNGYTTRDFTAYMESFPSPAIERILWLEADRMGGLAITPKNLEQERGIVKEERRLRTDDDPGGKVYEELYLAAYAASRYRFPVIGFMRDLDLITLPDAQAYFKTYYAPNNCTLVLAGAISPKDGFALAQRYFGGIPSQAPPPLVVNDEPVQRGTKRVRWHMPAELPAVAVAFKAVAAKNPDRPALDILQTILAHGESSRLYRAVVRGKEIATGVDISFNYGIDPELFWFYGQLRPGHTAAELESAIDAELVKIRDAEPDFAELRKAKNILQADYVRGLQSVSGRANRLGFYETVFGDYTELFREVDRWEAVTAADVRRVAGTYLIDDARTTIELVPERRAGGAPPPRAGGAPGGGAPGAPVHRVADAPSATAEGEGR
jgi:zinc protease